jgi:CCR4-NOT transcription complex subunit 7/8
MAKWNALGNNAIRDVWAGNLEEEFCAIREAVETCPFIAMDTEFPGIVARPLGNFRTTHEFYYQTLRCNVNILKIIQLGITLSDEDGNPPAKGPSTWQFNFRFCLHEDVYAQDSIDLLTSSGINFERFEREGVDVSLFAQLLTTSGLVLCPGIQWLSFHSGYDFGYIVKTLTGTDLPEKESEFFEILRLFFPAIYDIKFLLKESDLVSHQVGLDTLAETLQLKRIGPAHQAGSDSLLTALCFFKWVNDYCKGEIPVHTCGVLYGLGEDSGMTPLTGTGTPVTPSTPVFPTAPTTQPVNAPAQNPPTGNTRSSGGSSAYINSVVYHGMAPPGRTVNNAGGK